MDKITPFLLSLTLTDIRGPVLSLLPHNTSSSASIFSISGVERAAPLPAERVGVRPHRVSRGATGRASRQVSSSSELGCRRPSTRFRVRSSQPRSHRPSARACVRVEPAAPPPAERVGVRVEPASPPSAEHAGVRVEAPSSSIFSLQLLLLA